MTLLSALVVLFLLFQAVRWMFGMGNHIERVALTVEVDPGAMVSVALDGGPLQRAEDTLRLFENDVISTGAESIAAFWAFDGLYGRLDEHTDFALVQSDRGSLQSSLHFRLNRGTLWIAVPDQEAYSGSIVRTVTTEAFRAELTPGSEMVISNRSILVFTAEELGVKVWIPSFEKEIFIGEGQQYTLPASPELARSPYAYRSPLDMGALRSAFVEESREQRSVGKENVKRGQLEENFPVPAQSLSIETPADGAFIREATVLISGTFGEGIDRVRVNGHLAALDREKGTFSQQIAIGDNPSTLITVEGLLENGIAALQLQRTVQKDVLPPQSPTITEPSAQGTTYRTAQDELIIRGSAPTDAVGILVNDYRLQLFRPSDATWSYLASKKLQNLRDGRNLFEVFALDNAGNKSPAATLEILVEEGQEGIVVNESNAMSVGQSSSVPMLRNAPLLPGSLVVTGPTPGERHTATGSEVLIAGTTVSETHSVWVNDYKLRLYIPGKTTWNYIASTAYQTLRSGTNRYTIISRNAKGEILDKEEYTIVYNP
jgi:hypothetical protein